MVALPPADTVAAGLIVNTIEFVTTPQGPTGSFEVIVNVTVPAAISAADGVYTGVVILGLLNVPVPEVVQVTNVVLPPIVPANVKVLPAHIEFAGPALTVAAGFIVKVIDEATATHGPAGSFDVIVKTTEPATISAADGVYTAVVDDAELNVPVLLFLLQ